MQNAPRTLLCWSDRAGQRLAHHGARPADDQGPVLRLLDHSPPYAQVRLLCLPTSMDATRLLQKQVEQRGIGVDLRVLELDDPSDYEALFLAVPSALHGLPPTVDVLLSAGTPQAQTIWVLLVQAGLLHARMLKVIPAEFVPHRYPEPVQEVRLSVEGFPEVRALREEISTLRGQARLDGLIGQSAPMIQLKDRIARVARADVPVLITGETGTGKERVARALHMASPRASGPFIAENCGAFAEGVLASELFGHERGAFTGATARRRGLFELAHGGTLLLDEIGELPLRTQAMLLRVLQEGELRRVGGEQSVPVQVRVVAATHRDLSALVKSGQFREDLYFRLKGAALEVPPLRARSGDLELLIGHFLGSTGLSLTPAALALLRQYPWPGNVRELKAEVERWKIFCDRRVRPDDLSPELRGVVSPAPATSAVPTLAVAVAALEQQMIAAVLEKTGHNLSATARRLGVDRNTLKRKLAQRP